MVASPAMPPKRETSKKKQKKQRAAVAATAPHVEEAPPVADDATNDERGQAYTDDAKPPAKAKEHGGENLFAGAKKVADLAGKGKLDAKRFAKHMPEVAQLLRDGSADPQAIAEKAIQSVGLYQNLDRFKARPAPDHNLFLWIAGHLSKRVFPESAFTFTSTGDLESRTAMDFHTTLSEKIESKYGSIAPAPANGEEQKRALAVAAMESFHETFELFKVRVAADHFGGNVARLQQSCNMPGAPLSLFVSWVEFSMENNYDVELYAKEVLQPYDTVVAAAKGVAEGFDLFKKSCWECGQPPEAGAKLMNCSQCSTARYCSKRCQLSAWKDGHKHKCCELGSKMDLFQQLIREVDKTYKNVELPGSTSSPSLGYRTVASYCHTPISIVDPEGYPEHFASKQLGSLSRDELEGPSMSIFYSNLERIVKGDFWIFGNSTENLLRSLPEEGDEENRSMLMFYFRGICHFLMFDEVKYAEKYSLVLSDPEVARDVVDAFCPVLAVLRVRFGTLTASVFLYWCNNHAVHDSCHQSLKAETIKNFRAEFHK